METKVLALGRRCLTFFVCGVWAASAALAQSNPDGVATITITDAAGLAGSEVEVQVVFGHTGATQALTVDMEFDPSFFSNVDLSDCVELIESSQNAAVCFVRNPPNENQIRINLLNVPFPADIADGPFGTMRFTINPAAVPGDSTTISVIDVVLEGSPDLDLNTGTIGVLARPPAELDVTPPSINFGSVFVGSTSPENPVEICNVGEETPIQAEDLTVSSISITGAGFAQGVGGTCGALPFLLEAGECCTYHVTLSPATDGPASGSISVVSDAGAIVNDTVSLAGLGVSPPTELAFVQSPDYAVVNGPMYGGVVVHVLDGNGALYTADSSTVVVISIDTDPTGMAILSGTSSVTVTGGIAVFADLSIDQVGSGFVLEATDQAGLLTSDTSDIFSVLPLELLQDRFETPD